MPDLIDNLTEQEELLTKLRIDQARYVVQNKKGPKDCINCGRSNNRANQGFGVCVECTNEFRNKDAARSGADK